MKPKRDISPFLLPITIVWFIVMCLLFFMPGDDVPSIGILEKLYIDKVVHVGLFLVFIILCHLTISRSRISTKSKSILLVGVIVFSIGFGILVEYIQRDYVLGRSFDIFDWVADTSGVVLALILIVLMRKISVQNR